MRLFRGHPGGGQYDVLWLKSDTGLDLLLNRLGTIQIHGRHDGEIPRWEPTSWADYLQSDPQEFLTRLREACGLTSGPTPLSTPTVLVHRLIAAIAALNSFGKPIAIELGFIDSSGGGDGPARWLHTHPGLAVETRESDWYREPGYRYWRVRTSTFDGVFETSGGILVDRSGASLDLSIEYDRVGRRFGELLGAALRFARVDS